MISLGSLQSCHHQQVSDAEATKICLSENIYQKAQSYYLHHCPETPKEATRGRKIKVSWVKDLLSARNMPPGKPDGLRQDTRGRDVRSGWRLKDTLASDDIRPLTLCSEEEVRALEGVLNRRHPGRNTPYTLLLLLATRKKTPSVR